MKRVICGATLFLCLAVGHGYRLLACDDRTTSRSYTSVFESEDNMVVITSDDDVVTVIVFSNAKTHTEWI